MAERFSLKDHLFNPATVAQLGGEYAVALPDFDRARFEAAAVAGLEGRSLLERLDWLADCVEAQLSADFPIMAAQLEAAMPAPLDAGKSDDDFGHFIHAVPGILAVRHGLEDHRSRALHLLHAATQRFSMEFYIRPFLSRWPDETLTTLKDWSVDPHYHVRRLVSEGTRPRLPWATALTLAPEQTLPLLDALHADRTRYVTRSVANHLNDLSKTHPDLVVDRLMRWNEEGRQTPSEMAWMTRHALRSLVKSGHPRALEAIGFRADFDARAELEIVTPELRIGEALTFTCTISADSPGPVLIDYRIDFARPDRRAASKVFKLKQGRISAGAPLKVEKTHKLKADATTFTWYPGPHRLTLQVNGVDRADASFIVI